MGVIAEAGRGSASLVLAAGEDGECGAAGAGIGRHPPQGRALAAGGPRVVLGMAPCTVAAGPGGRMAPRGGGCCAEAWEPGGGRGAGPGPGLAAESERGASPQAGVTGLRCLQGASQ